MRPNRPAREAHPLPSRPWSRAALPLAGLLAAGVTTLSLTTPRESLRAEAYIVDDSDADGLPDAQESVQQTSPYHQDTDRDGYSDAEEIARGSCPFAAHDVPLPTDSSLALTARGEAGMIRVMMLAYFTDGNVENKVFGFGIVLDDGRVIGVAASHLLSNATTNVIPTLDGNGQVSAIEFEIPPGPLMLLGHFSLFATMSVAGQGTINAAAVLDLFTASDGVVLKSGPAYQSAMGLRGSGSGTGTVLQPIPTEEGLPLDWESGRICQQKTMPVGYNNGVVITRVVSAECSDGWDAHCSPSECKASAGDEFATVDPAGLVGG